MYNRCAKIVMYAGIGVGVIIFAFFGMLPGSFLGGAVGLKIAGALFGVPLEAGLVPKVIVAAFMVIGTLLSALTIISTSAAAGRMIGDTAGWLFECRTLAAGAVRVKVKK